MKKATGCTVVRSSRLPSTRQYTRPDEPVWPELCLDEFKFAISPESRVPERAPGTPKITIVNNYEQRTKLRLRRGGARVRSQPMGRGAGRQGHLRLPPWGHRHEPCRHAVRSTEQNLSGVGLREKSTIVRGGIQTAGPLSLPLFLRRSLANRRSSVGSHLLHDSSA